MQNSKLREFFLKVYRHQVFHWISILILGSIVNRYILRFIPQDVWLTLGIIFVAVMIILLYRADARNTKEG